MLVMLCFSLSLSLSLYIYTHGVPKVATSVCCKKSSGLTVVELDVSDDLFEGNVFCVWSRVFEREEVWAPVLDLLTD